MELLVLVDNNTYIDVDAAGEPGASFVLDDGEQRILFDMGITDIFLKNAAFFGVDLSKVTNKRKQAYMRRYLEIVTTVSSILLLKSGTAENKQKKDELWKFIREENPYVYKKLRHGLMGHVLHLPGKGGRRIALAGYKATRKIYGFN